MVALQHATEVYGDVGALTSEDGGQVKNVQLCAAPLPCFWAGELKSYGRESRDAIGAGVV